MPLLVFNKLYAYIAAGLGFVSAILAAKYYRNKAMAMKFRAKHAEAKAQKMVLIHEASNNAEKAAKVRHEKAIKLGRDYWNNRHKFLRDD